MADFVLERCRVLQLGEDDDDAGEDGSRTHVGIKFSQIHVWWEITITGPGGWPKRFSSLHFTDTVGALKINFSEKLKSNPFSTKLCPNKGELHEHSSTHCIRCSGRPRTLQSSKLYYSLVEKEEVQDVGVRAIILILSAGQRRFCSTHDSLMPTEEEALTTSAES